MKNPNLIAAPALVAMGGGGGGGEPPGGVPPPPPPPPATTPDHKEVTMKTQIRIAALSLLTILCLMLAVAPAMAGTLYSNGPYDGNTAAWGIGGNHVVTDSN